MGSSRWDSSDWKDYATATRSKSIDEVFATKSLADELDPKKIKIRESRDSVLNPNSSAIIVALDVTGSMGYLADNLAKKGLGVLFEEILSRKPVPDPHLMIMGNGDSYYDKVPLQVSQFEADITITKWLEKLYLEKGGGENNFESYNLPWYFAATRTAIDCFEKRGKKGYLFTVGDEEPPPFLLADHIAGVIGDTLQYDLGTPDLLAMVRRMYNVFHVIVEEGDYARSHLDGVVNKWTALLGQRSLRLSDHSKLAEVIVSAIEVSEGRSRDAVLKSWDKSVAMVVSHAIATPSTVASKKGVVRV